jgi:uncharacterized protein (TIGR01244 family)
MLFESILSRITVLATACAVVMACGSSDPSPDGTSAGAGSESVAELLTNGAEPYPGVWVGGQPTPEQFKAAQEAGIQTVINLRRPGERGAKGEQKRVEDLGMTYLAVPISGAEDLDERNARVFSRALDEAARPVIVHCSSGARVGALFAMRAFYVEGLSVEDSLTVGRAAGMDRYEDEVRQRLEGAPPTKVRRKASGKSGERKAKADGKKGRKRAGGSKKAKASP